MTFMVKVCEKTVSLFFCSFSKLQHLCPLCSHNHFSMYKTCRLINVKSDNTSFLTYFYFKHCKFIFIEVHFWQADLLLVILFDLELWFYSYGCFAVWITYSSNNIQRATRIPPKSTSLSHMSLLLLLFVDCYP